MLPISEDEPASLPQCSVVALIAPTIAIEFGGPVATDVLWHASMLGTPMPKAAINEYSHTLARKDDIGRASEAPHGLHMLPKPHAHAMDRGTNGSLGPGVKGTIAAHHCPYAW